MKNKLPRITEKTRTRIEKIIDSVLSVSILLFIFKAVALIHAGNSSEIYFFVVYLLFAASHGLQASITYKKDKLLFIKHLCFAGVFVAAGTIFIFVGVNTTGAVILMESFLAIVLADRILAVVTGGKLVSRMINVLIAIMIVLISISYFTVQDENLKRYLQTYSFLVAAVSLGHVIFISFSQMRYGVLRKIIRKTFAAEILFGMMLLIISFSFVFQALEPGIKTYLDAVWYCFSIVTTIGLGDFTVTVPFSRFLSVILGIYGIVVVALVTSIIVNFYNEVKDEKNDDETDGAAETIRADLPEKTDQS